MFDFLDHLDSNNIEETTLGQSVNKLYDDFEVKIKELVLWELDQIQRVQGEIQYIIKDLPSDKALTIKYEKFAELEEEFNGFSVEEWNKNHNHTEVNNKFSISF